MRGVRRVLLTADNPPQPTRIADREIDLLMSLEDEDGIIIPPPRFSAGDEVEIIGGKRFWVGSHGLVKRIEPNGKALVLLSLLGRRVATRFAVAHLEFAQAPVGMAALAKGMDARARARLLRRVMDA
jgi:transcription antitermination factor NusG